MSLTQRLMLAASTATAINLLLHQAQPHTPGLIYIAIGIISGGLVNR